MHFSVQLRTPRRVYLKAHLRVNLEIYIKMQDAQEGAFVVEMKGTLEMQIELHLKMCMGVQLLVRKGAKNNLINGELDGALLVVLESTRKISLKKELKNAQKYQEKDGVHLRMNLAMSIKIHQRVHLRLRYGCT